MKDVLKTHLIEDKAFYEFSRTPFQDIISAAFAKVLPSDCACARDPFSI